MTTQGFSLCCIVPPHILRALAQRGAQTHNRAGMNRLLVSETLHC